MSGDPDPLTDFFGPPIDVYTRAQAIADGALIEVPAQLAAEAGIRHHLAMTAAAHADTVAWSEADNKLKGTLQDETGRLWDVLTMVRYTLGIAQAAYVRDGIERNRLGVSLVRTPRPGRGRMPRKAFLNLHIGPDDNGDPCFTLMLPGEG